MKIVASGRAQRVRFLLYLLTVSIFSPSILLGQIRIGLRTEYRDVLQFEAVRAYITVYNDTPDVLILGDDATDEKMLKLHLFIDDRDGLPESRSGTAPLFRKESILPGTSRTFLRDVTKWFRMIGMGRYRLMVDGLRGGNRYESNPVMVYVVAGLVVSEVERILPGYEDRVRRYSLRYWRREKYEHLFLRVDELSKGVNMNYGVVDLGRVIRVFKPLLTVDHDGNVKVVHQSARDCYTRTLFRSEPDRLRFVDQTYHLPNGDPYPNLRNSK